MTDLSPFYKAYGESLATRLAAIAHTPQQPRFVFVEEMGSDTEVKAATQSTLKTETNVLIWEAFTEGLSDGRRDNYHTRISGSLAVIRKDNTTPKTELQALCRRIALKAMALMVDDSRYGQLADENIELEFDGSSGDAIPNIAAGWTGWGYTFSWIIGLDLTLDKDDLIS